MRRTTINPHLKITNSIVLAEVSQGGNAYRRIKELINDSLQTSETKEKLISAMKQDKKNDASGISFILQKSINKTEIQTVEEKEILLVL